MTSNVLMIKDEHIQREIKKAMRKKKYNQKAMSELLNVSEKTFNTKVNAPHKFYLGELLFISQELNVRLDILLGVNHASEKNDVLERYKAVFDCGPTDTHKDLFDVEDK